MSDFSATDIALEGFRVTREKPVPILVWCGLEFLLLIAVTLFTAQYFGPQYMAFVNFAKTPMTNPDMEKVLTVYRPLFPLFLSLAPVLIVYQVIMSCALFRAMLKPASKAPAYLAFGGDELRQVLLALAIFGLAILAEIAVVIAIVLLTFVSSLVIPKGQAPFLGGLFAFLLAVGLVCGLIFAGVRLSLAAPATFERRKVTLLSVWPLTRGRFWPLLGAYFMAVILAILVYLAGYVISAVLTIVTHGGWVAAAQLAEHDKLTVDMVLTPTSLGASAVAAVLTVLTRVIVSAPAISAYLALKPKN